MRGLGFLKLLGAAGGACLQAGRGWAETAVSGEIVPRVAETPSYGWEIAKVLFFLGCLGVVLWLLRYVGRLSWGQRRQAAGGRPLTVVAQHYIDPKKALVLVEVEGWRLLLANAADTLTLLTVLAGPEAGADGLDRTPAGQPRRQGSEAHAPAA